MKKNKYKKEERASDADEYFNEKSNKFTGIDRRGVIHKRRVEINWL